MKTDEFRSSLAPTDLELEPQELLVLAAALRVMMMADGELSVEEGHFVTDMARRLGLDATSWELLWNQAAQQLPTVDAVKRAVNRVKRQAAREVIYEHLYNLAESDQIDDREWDLLEWLDEEWYRPKE